MKITITLLIILTLAVGTAFADFFDKYENSKTIEVMNINSNQNDIYKINISKEYITLINTDEKIISTNIQSQKIISKINDTFLEIQADAGSKIGDIIKCELILPSGTINLNFIIADANNCTKKVMFHNNDKKKYILLKNFKNNNNCEAVLFDTKEDLEKYSENEERISIIECKQCDIKSGYRKVQFSYSK